MSIARPHAAALSLMLLSGFAGLGYQIVWTQQCALWLGHEAASVLAVVAAFFGGMGAGALLLGRRVEDADNPARWYALCETVIGVWGCILIVVMAPCSAWLLKIIGPEASPLWQWSVAFFGTFLLLLPATAAMGVTLPAMERLLSAHLLSTQHGADRSVSALYAANTFGAVVGVLVCAFVLVPQFGLRFTTFICVAANALCAAIAWRALPVISHSEKTAHTPSKEIHRWMIRLAICGLLGIGYEVLVVRVLSQIDEDTVYTFALILAVYLIGTALGAACYQRWARGDARRVTDYLLALLAFACLLGTGSLWFADMVRVSALANFGASMSSALIAETVTAVFAFGLPTLVMGALFSHLCNGALAAGCTFGRALAANTLGAALAPLLFGVVLFPALGAKNSLLIVAAGYLALMLPRRWRSWQFFAPAAVAASIALFAPALTFIDIPEGGRVVSYREGVLAAVSVVADSDGVARLRIDNRQQEGSSSTGRFDGRQALLPLLLHPHAKNVLFLGIGTGITASTAATEADVDAVELVPEVIDAAQWFIAQAGNRLPRMFNGDARRFVKAGGKNYDVIVSDNFHPARSGSGSLYTVEHFAAVRARLAGDGLFCQWLPLHQLDIETLRSIVASFVEVFPQGMALLANNSLDTPVIGLIGRGDAKRFDVETIRARLHAMPAVRRARYAIEDEFALLGSFVAGPAALARLANGAELNTDDHPVVAYRAPRITYVADSLPRDRLIDLLQDLSVTPQEIITNNDAIYAVRLAAYWRARDRFIVAGRDVKPTADVRAMLAQVRQTLLSVLRISPDFRPAYDPLLLMAQRFAAQDADAARAILAELASVQPARPEASIALHALAANGP